MKINELYKRDIQRRVNPAVVVSQRDSSSVHQEIDEYIFTNKITEEVYKFLNAIVTNKSGKTGVWINGYYGSGKSHFIKYLFYCLNKEFGFKALDNFIEAVKDVEFGSEVTPGGANVVRKKLENFTIEEIIFNIDTIADKSNDKQRITRVFLNQLNQHRGFNDSNVALGLYLEKPLSEKGVFEVFKKRVKEQFNEEWTGNEARFTVRYLDKIIDIALEFDPKIDRVSLKNSILNREQDYNIKFLINELKDYLQDKADSFRLIFLVDEVSQYIGTNTSLLLNLQTIVEEIGAEIGQKVWVVCTAQQDLSNLISNTDSKTEDFGKILGRFETRISLESNDAAYITKKRLLEKTSQGDQMLAEFYGKSKVAIENQFVFEHDHYKGYKDKQDFMLTYPFIPYQFSLISDVFFSFSNLGYVGEGVKNTERAILGITHFTAQHCDDKWVEYFVPFDRFFNNQFQSNLTHLARGILDRAYQINGIKKGDFEERVINVLFMISNLSETVAVNFPATINNISLLLLESVDTLKSDLQKRVQEVLDLLLTKNIIQVSEGKYRFLKEDEIEVANQIKTTSISVDDRLTYFSNDILEKSIGLRGNSFKAGSRDVKASIKIDDKSIYTTGEFEIRFYLNDSESIENLPMKMAEPELAIALNVWFYHDTDFKKKFDEYVRTQKYIKSNLSNTEGKKRDTLNAFADSNKQVLDELRIKFEQNFLATAIVSHRQIVDSNKLKGANPTGRFTEMVALHLERLFKHQALSNGYATTSNDLQKRQSNTQKSLVTTLTPAENEVNDYLNREPEGILVDDVVKRYERAPFGWKDLSTLDILLCLMQKGKRSFEYQNEDIDGHHFAAEVANSAKRRSITIHKSKDFDPAEVAEFIRNINNDIFAERIILVDGSDVKALQDQLKSNLEPKIMEFNRLKEDYFEYPFTKTLEHFYQRLSEMYNARSFETLLGMVKKDVRMLKALRDEAMQAKDFINDNIENYNDIRNFYDKNAHNIESLEEKYTELGENLKEYIKRETAPWNTFPKYLKIYRELKSEVDKFKKGLKERVLAEYEQIFEQLDARRVELGLEDRHITADKDHTLNAIKRLEYISQLEIRQLNAPEFKAAEFKKLEDEKLRREAKAKGKEELYVESISVSLAKEMEPRTITNETELDSYIEELHVRLKAKLEKNKKIYLS